jgi:hypothetical protein
MKFFGMGAKGVEGHHFFDGGGCDDEPEDDEAIKQLRKHMAILALWVAAVRSAPYFLSVRK